MKLKTFHLSVIFICLGLAALIISGVMLWLQPGSDAPSDVPTQPVLTGWQTIDNEKYFYNDNGIPVTGLFPCPQGTYYFREDGKMATGWVDFAEGRRYFDQDGRMHVGFLELDEKTYCCNREGLMCVGWQDLQDGRYYFDETGAMITTTGWLSVTEGTWYIKEDGQPYTGWMQTDEARYYFQEDGKMATGMIEISGEKRLFSSDGNYIPLVNPWNPVPEDYEANLVDIEGHQMDSTCVAALREMITAARAAGLTCVLNSSYRDMNTQIYLWDKRYDDYISQGYSPEDAYRLTARRVAYPGTSEHHTGLAIDIVEIIKDGTLYAWFNEHAWEYGFTVRYKGEKETLTGIKDEPWHLRYVGRDVAKILWEKDYCLEEYFTELSA